MNVSTIFLKWYQLIQWGRKSENVFIKVGPYITNVYKTCIFACGLILR